MSKSSKKKSNSFPIVAIIIIAALVYSFLHNNETSNENNDQDDRDNKTEAKQADIVVDGETIYDFYTIVNDIGIDSDTIEVEKIEDWAQGPRYKFTASGKTFTVYCNMEGKIKSINLGLDIKLYEEGYEIWKLENFILNDTIETELIIHTEDCVKECLNYPNTADFSVMDWSFGRKFNLYYSQGSVKAQNALGVESEMPFSAVYWIENETMKLVYLQVDYNVVLDELDEYQLPERKKVDTVDVTEDTEEDGIIHIIDGQLGEYGKEVQLDSYEYIWYMIPAGKYEVTGKSKNCMIYVDKNEITRNSDGYVEMQNVGTYTLGYGETTNITIGEDEHLFNIIGSEYTLKKIN